MRAYPTQAQLRERFEYKDGELIFKIKASQRTNIGDVAGCINSWGYVQIGINDERYFAHRLIWIMHNKDIPVGMDIDHINQIKHDNRIENLRLATRSQNKSNGTKYKNSTSNFKGVCWHKQKKKWQAQIKINNKTIYLGSRDTQDAAHELYVAAANKLHGDYACLK